MPNWYKWLAERTARFRCFPVHTRLYLLELMLYLLAARLALRVIPFRWLIWFFGHPPRLPRDTFAERRRIGVAARPPYTVHQNKITEAERERLRKDAWWLTREAVWFLPGESVCFPQAIAAHLFLRRLGMRTSLYYGAATLPERGLTAHVWLQDGNEIIVGRTDGQSYHILAHYPEADGEWDGCVVSGT
jgi:hypothetical protein